MPPHTTEPPDSTAVDRTDADRSTGRTRRLLDRLSAYRSSGTLAMVAGGALLARAVRSGRRGRSLVQGLLGAGLLALGLRQRLSTDGAGAPDRPRYTDTARSGSAGPDEGEPTTEDLVRDPQRDATPGDSDGDVSADEAAAEPAEATGPEPEQSQPTQTEDTEPEGSPEADESHTQADVPGSDGASTESDETPSGETSPDSGSERGGSPGAGASASSTEESSGAGTSESTDASATEPDEGAGDRNPDEDRS